MDRVHVSSLPSPSLRKPSGDAPWRDPSPPADVEARSVLRDLLDVRNQAGRRGGEGGGAQSCPCPSPSPRSMSIRREALPVSPGPLPSATPEPGPGLRPPLPPHPPAPQKPGLTPLCLTISFHLSPFPPSPSSSGAPSVRVGMWGEGGVGWEVSRRWLFGLPINSGVSWREMKKYGSR